MLLTFFFFLHRTTIPQQTCLISCHASMSAATVGSDMRSWLGSWSTTVCLCCVPSHWPSASSRLPKCPPPTSTSNPRYVKGTRLHVRASATWLFWLYPPVGYVGVPGDGHRSRGDSALHVQGLLQPGGGVPLTARQTQSLQLQLVQCFWSGTGPGVWND